MNTYLCSWNGKSAEIDAESSYKAQDIMRAEMKCRFPKLRCKPHEVTTVLIARDGMMLPVATIERVGIA